MRARTEGIISGTGSKTCILKYVSHEYEVKANEMALTSGLDSLFPEDIPVGSVTRITKKGAGLFQNIEVTPFQDTKTRRGCNSKAMKKALFLGIIFLALLLESRISVFGTPPNLTAAIAYYLGLKYGETKGIFFGSLIGL